MCRGQNDQQKVELAIKTLKELQLDGNQKELADKETPLSALFGNEVAYELEQKIRNAEFCLINLSCGEYNNSLAVY